jgi:hypothetical protein
MQSAQAFWMAAVAALALVSVLFLTLLFRQTAHLPHTNTSQNF